MSATIYFKNITTYLHQYSDLVATLNSFGFTDEAVYAENLFAEILNMIFNWHLVNANELKRNQDSFDLIDNVKGIYVQVTTNKGHKTKYEKTKKAFRLTYSNEAPVTLIVLFISKKITKSLLEDKTEGNITYKAYDIEKLLGEINYKLRTPAKLEKLNRILESAVEPVLLKDKSTKLAVRVKMPQQKGLVAGKGLYIKREMLIERLYTFCQADNGLLIGGPGYGKSFIINELQSYCHKQRIPSYVIRINELIDGTDVELNTVIGASSSWLEALKNLGTSKTRKGILIFDAYDTAKDEKLKTTIYQQIRKSVEALKDKWTVLVSARTYDAIKSIQLQAIFPHASYNQLVSCRHFEIPELSNDELLEVLEQVPIIKSAVTSASKQVFNLLRTPYFLKLVEQIASDKDSIGEALSGIETEAQLLEIFWRTKVEDSPANGVFVQKLTKLLLSNSSLIADRDEIVTDTNLSVFERLLSLHIIEETFTKAQIGFSHNILLDFAIAKYYLSTDVDAQIKFVSDNQKLPFIFRQSFVYFYSQLLKIDKDKFWEHYARIKTIDTPLFRIFHQTILNYILVNFYRSPEEILPNLKSSNAEINANSVRKTLESIRYITKGQLRLNDIDLLLTVTLEMHFLLVWEVGNLINKGIVIYKGYDDQAAIKKLAKASCNYLEYVLKSKDSKDGELIIRNSRFWGIENVCQTYVYNQPRAKRLINKVFEMLKEPNFELTIFQTLANNLLPIIETDSEFGMSLYEKLYLHNEKSEEVTDWGGGVINLRSTRKQDFGHIYYVLEDKFEEYLKVDFVAAMRIGVSLINKFRKDKRLSFHKEVLQLKIGDMTGSMAFDYDHYEVDDKHGEFSHVKKIFDALENITAASTSIADIESKVHLLISKIEAGKLWRWLLNYLCKFPKLLKKTSYLILGNTAIYENDDTLHEAGQLIRVTWEYLSTAQKKTIEFAILGLKKSTVVHPELVARRISRLLNCIPNDEFTIAESAKFVDENVAVENSIIVEPKRNLIANARYHSEAEKILYAGFELKYKADRAVFAHYDKIEKFNRLFENKHIKGAIAKAYKEQLPHAIYLFQKIQDNGFRNEQILRSCDIELSRFLEIVTELGKRLTKKEQTIARDVALWHVRDTKYIPATYEVGKMDDRFGGGSDTTVRRASVKTLQNLLYNFDDKEAEKALIECISDNSTFIRYCALYTLNYLYQYNYDIVWPLVTERLKVEKENICFGRLLFFLQQEGIIKDDLAQVKACMEIAITRLREVDEEIVRDNWKALSVGVLKIIFRHDRDWAFAFILRNVDLKEFCRNMVFEIRTGLNNFNAKDDFLVTLEKGAVVFEILQEILRFRFNRILQHGTVDITLQEDFQIVDHVIQNLYFAFDYESGNSKGRKLSDAERTAFYHCIKPILIFTTEESGKINNGFMAMHTGYYFMKLLNVLLPIDPAAVLRISNAVVLTAANNGFSFDRSALSEVVQLTDSVIVDYKGILEDQENFSNLLIILDQFANSGSEEAIELIWRLREAF